MPPGFLYFFQGKRKQISVISFKFHQPSLFQNFMIPHEKLTGRQTAFGMAVFGPWIGKIQINFIHFILCEHFTYIFCIHENERQRKIPLNRLSKGYKDFEKTLELAGVLHRIGVKTMEEFRRDAERVFEQFQMYREAHPGSTPPKPEGNCVICPDCQGKGLHLKKLPLLKVDVGKVCKTCGGSGYLPK